MELVNHVQTIALIVIQHNVKLAHRAINLVQEIVSSVLHFVMPVMLQAIALAVQQAHSYQLGFAAYVLLPVTPVKALQRLVIHAFKVFIWVLQGHVLFVQIAQFVTLQEIVYHVFMDIICQEQVANLVQIHQVIV